MATRPKSAAKPSAKAKADQAAAAADSDTDAEESRDVDTICKAVRFNPDALAGELGDFVISQMKAAKHIPDWEKMDEAEQREKIEQAMHWSKQIIGGVVDAVAARGMPNTPAKIGKFSGAVGESTIEIKCVIAFDKTIADKLASGVTDAVLVFGSHEAFMTGAMSVEPQPNQNGLGLDTVEHDEDGVILDENTKVTNPPGEPIAPGTVAAAEGRAP